MPQRQRLSTGYSLRIHAGPRSKLPPWSRIASPPKRFLRAVPGSGLTASGILLAALWTDTESKKETRTMQDTQTTGPSASRLIRFEPSKRQKPPSGDTLHLWLIEQLGILAVALGETVTPERFRIYAEDLLSDLSKEQIETALMRA